MSVKALELLNFMLSNNVQVTEVEEKEYGVQFQLTKGRESMNWGFTWASLISVVVAHLSLKEQEEFKEALNSLVKPLKPL